MPRKVLSQLAGQKTEVLVAETYQALLAVPEPSSTVTTFATIGIPIALAGSATYSFNYQVIFTSAATTTGLKLQLSTPGFITLAVRFEVPITASTSVVAYASAAPAGATGTGVAVAGTKYLATVGGVIQTLVAGSLDLQFASEVAGSAVTIKLGSNVQLTRLT